MVLLLWGGKMDWGCSCLREKKHKTGPRERGGGGKGARACVEMRAAPGEKPGGWTQWEKPFRPATFLRFTTI